MQLGNEHCMLYVGDCREAIPRWRATTDERAKFVFADPPFNIGQEYDGYQDNLSPREYREFTVNWVSAASTLLADDGVLAIHVPDEVVEDAFHAAQSVPLQYAVTRIAWVIWHYRFGQYQDGSWIRSHAHCLIYARDPNNYTWNGRAVAVPSDRATQYNDPRTRQTANPGRRPPLDVWGINDTFAADYAGDGPYWGRVQGNNRERRHLHPNQLPEIYLERLIRAYTNPGDLVWDPFVGSGTTPTVARALGRRFAGSEISQTNAESAWQRVQDGAVRIPETG